MASVAVAEQSPGSAVPLRGAAPNDVASVSMYTVRFPGEITTLVTKLTNGGLSVLALELGLQSPICNGIEGLMAIMVAFLTGD